jgi:hypothetical protein
VGCLFVFAEVFGDGYTEGLFFYQTQFLEFAVVERRELEVLFTFCVEITGLHFADEMFQKVQAGRGALESYCFTLLSLYFCFRVEAFCEEDMINDEWIQARN